VPGSKSLRSPTCSFGFACSRPEPSEADLDAQARARLPEQETPAHVGPVTPPDGLPVADHDRGGTMGDYEIGRRYAPERAGGGKSLIDVCMKPLPQCNSSETTVRAGADGDADGVATERVGTTLVADGTSNARGAAVGDTDAQPATSASAAMQTTRLTRAIPDVPCAPLTRIWRSSYDRRLSDPS
jgi:hypothetical protein